MTKHFGILKFGAKYLFSAHAIERERGKRTKAIEKTLAENLLNTRKLVRFRFRRLRKDIENPSNGQPLLKGTCCLEHFLLPSLCLEIPEIHKMTFPEQEMETVKDFRKI